MKRFSIHRVHLSLFVVAMIVDIKYLSGGNLLKAVQDQTKNHTTYFIPAFKNFVLIKQIQKIH